MLVRGEVGVAAAGPPACGEMAGEGMLKLAPTVSVAWRRQRGKGVEVVWRETVRSARVTVVVGACSSGWVVLLVARTEAERVVAPCEAATAEGGAKPSIPPCICATSLSDV